MTKGGFWMTESVREFSKRSLNSCVGIFRSAMKQKCSIKIVFRTPKTNMQIVEGVRNCIFINFYEILRYSSNREPPCPPMRATEDHFDHEQYNRRAYSLIVF